MTSSPSNHENLEWSYFPSEVSFYGSNLLVMRGVERWSMNVSPFRYGTEGEDIINEKIILAILTCVIGYLTLGYGGILFAFVLVWVVIQ